MDKDLEKIMAPFECGKVREVRQSVYSSKRLVYHLGFLLGVDIAAGANQDAIQKFFADQAVRYNLSADFFIGTTLMYIGLYTGYIMLEIIEASREVSKNE